MLRHLWAHQPTARSSTQIFACAISLADLARSCVICCAKASGVPAAGSKPFAASAAYFGRLQQSLGIRVDAIDHDSWKTCRTKHPEPGGGFVPPQHPRLSAGRESMRRDARRCRRAGAVTLTLREVTCSRACRTAATHVRQACRRPPRPRPCMARAPCRPCPSSSSVRQRDGNWFRFRKRPCRSALSVHAGARTFSDAANRQRRMHHQSQLCGGHVHDRLEVPYRGAQAGPRRARMRAAEDRANQRGHTHRR
jgi:hypothetical protein